MQIGGRQTRDQANGYYDFSGLNPFFSWSDGMKPECVSWIFYKPLRVKPLYISIVYYIYL